MNPIIDLPKLPPHSIETEQSLLGATFLNAVALETAGELVDEEDFYSGRSFANGHHEGVAR